MNDQIVISLSDISLPPTQEASREITRCVDALAKDPKVTEIWVFGSCAHGMPGPDSDVDLLVVRESGDKVSSRVGLEAARRISRLKLSLPVEAVVISKEILRERLAKPFGIYRDLADFGKRIYERAA